MKSVTSFVGINNVTNTTRLKTGELTVALNVDLDATGAIVTRRGRTLLRAGKVSSLWRSRFGLLCVLDTDFGLMSDDGLTFTPLFFGLGCDDRVWYTTRPDGKVVFSNGYITGLTDGVAVYPWGVPMPIERGDSVAGETPYWLTYIRQSDKIESAPLYCPPTLIGAPLTGLPVRSGFDIGVYYALDGVVGFYAGSTSTDSFVFTGEASQLINPCQTEHLQPMPAGTCLSNWGARTLVAVGNVLWATSPYRREQRDVRRDFIQLPDPITFVYGVDEGIWLGTTTELLFLRGKGLDQLKQDRMRAGPVVLGSGVPANFTLIPPDKRPGGALGGAFCISDGEIVACSNSGEVAVYAAGQYKSNFTEVVATTRVRDGVLQYLASA